MSKLTKKDITPKELFDNRRAIMKMGVLFPLLFGSLAFAKGLKFTKSSNKDKLEPNTFKEITTYNNFYEYTVDKDVYKYVPSYTTYEPWAITIDGLVNKPIIITAKELISKFKLEERIYRMRCVEAWSMVIPWIGFPLKDLLEFAGVTSEAKYVKFETRYDDVFPKTDSRVISFPYVDALRLDEARHPLTIIAVGLYGKELTMQNGAPLRLVVPWKYGFKSVKSIHKITLTKDQPVNTWQKINSDEYGFYANVNPSVPHPRWSQASERKIGKLFRQKTLMFNGYDEVASLYTGMDLVKNF